MSGNFAHRFFCTQHHSVRRTQADTYHIAFLTTLQRPGIPLKLRQTLITTLSKSKTMSRAIGERLTDSKITQRQIEESRERYRPVAVRGSLLYFTVAELCRVDVMYQYSLDYFKVSGIHLAGICPEC